MGLIKSVRAKKNRYKKYAQSLTFRRSKEDRFTQIGEILYEYCKSIAPYRTGTLYEGIDMKRYKNKIVISVKGKAREYAKFVEYGTGVRGLNNPHPAPPSHWVYNMHYYLTGKDWTGMEPRAFMYRTYLYALSILSMRARNIKWFNVTYGYSGTKDNPAVIIERIG